MAAPTHHLPGEGPRYVTDGGIETDLIFHHGVDLPEFAAFPLLDDPAGQRLLAQYYDAYAGVAEDARAHLLLESPTWRANPDWGAQVGYDAKQLARANADSIHFLRDLEKRYDATVPGIAISGTIGPRGDGYAPGPAVDPDEAAEYHSPQVAAFAAAGADLVTAYTLTDPGEAIGIIAAARAHGIPVGISFTVETDGRLPGGTSVAEAILLVDRAGGPDHYLLNCAHPEHLLAGLSGTPAERAAWDRIIGFRANASIASHAELDEAPELDEGDIPRFVAGHDRMAARLGEPTILGGCCGTDVRHVAALWGVPTR